MTKIICVAGFGDDASMFSPLLDVAASSGVQVLPINLPGFGAPALQAQTTSLEALAAHLAERARELETDTVLAHSVASIIASLATQQSGSPLKRVLSLEGNLTPEDAYFSGSAAQYDSAETFGHAFLDRLTEMAVDDPIIARYRARVERADPQALWELGCDAHRFSQANSPGSVLEAVPEAAYLYNPDNLPPSSLTWLKASALPKHELLGASHWASVDQPKLLLKAIKEIVDRSGSAEGQDASASLNRL